MSLKQLMLHIYKINQQVLNTETSYFCRSNVWKNKFSIPFLKAETVSTFLVLYESFYNGFVGVYHQYIDDAVTRTIE